MSKETIKILAFGDSITWGYVDFGSIKHPYATTLQTLLNKQFPSKNFEILERGINGERVIESMERRIAVELRDFPADIVIFLGGLNDCGWITQGKNSVDELIQSMKKIYEVLDTTNCVSHFVHVTIPFVHIDTQTDAMALKYSSAKKEANQRIINELQSKKRILLDINSEQFQFNFVNLEQSVQRELWCDVLHYSEKGYDKLAECIFQVLKPLF